MEKLIAITSSEDILSEYQQTPIAHLLEYHNLAKPYKNYENAQLLISMCMDNRKSLRIPDNFAYIIRSGGGTLRFSEFKVSFAVSVGQVKHIALIGHNHCGMVDLASKKELFIEGLVNNAGWQKTQAEEHFTHFSPQFEIGNETDFVLSEAKRLRQRYPKISIAPLMYLVEDNKLYLIREDE